jgi:small subunit ribosomal protein S4e
MLERKFCQTSFSRWSKLWSIPLRRFELDQRFEYFPSRNANENHSIRYPDPAIKVNDTVKIDLATGKITDFIKFDTGVIAMATGGRNMGRVGVITHRERHDGGFNIVHIKDAIDNSFATRESNVFVIGSEKPWISLPKGKGVKLTIAEERDRRRAHAIAGH